MQAFRVLCLNLYRGRVGTERLTDLLAVVEPDVAVFQELTPPLADVVAAQFGHGSLHPAARAAGRRTHQAV